MSEIVKMTADGLLVPRSVLGNLPADTDFLLCRQGQSLVLVPRDRLIAERWLADGLADDADATNRRAAQHQMQELLDALAPLREDPPMSLEEIQAEVDAVRREQRDAAHCR